MNHFNISIIKSALRIAGCAAAVILACTKKNTASLTTLGSTLAAAEVLGVLEEVFDKRKEN